MIHSTKHDRISITFLEMYANVRDIPRNIVECRLVCGTFHFHAADQNGRYISRNIRNVRYISRNA